MADPAQVFVYSNRTDTLNPNQPGVYLYTHGDGSNLGDVLKAALIRSETRWDVPQHLARVIFSEMIKDDVMGEYGYAISHMPFEVEIEYRVNTTTMHITTVMYGETRGQTSFIEFISPNIP